MHARISALLIALTLALTGLATAQERFGTLRGRATDQQGSAIPGVTVTLTNIQSGEVRTLVTDANGMWLVPDLSPGRYNVVLELAGFSKVERPDISVQLGRSFDIDAEMRVGELTETVQVTGEAVPLVDSRSTLIAHNVSADEFDRLPKGRSFQSIALTAPSVNQGEIEGGMQVNGASGAENAFTVDGIVTNSLINGQSRQNTVFEYLQEVQVKTSGISAEYGGALGGVVSAVTKSGGNVFRGEAHYFYEGSKLATQPVRRLVLDPVNEASGFYVQDTEPDINQQEFGGSLGGPIIRDRLYFYGAYSPRNESTDRLYRFTDGSDTFNRNIWKQQAFGKLTYATPRMTANWSTLWTPTKAEGSQFGYTGAESDMNTSPISAYEVNRERGYEINQVNTSGTADVNVTNSAFLSFRGGYFHDRYSDTNIPLITNYRYGNPTTSINDQLPLSVQGQTGFENTPRAQINEFDTTKRFNFNVDYNHAFSALGFHTLKGGYGIQRTENDINSFYPGGYVNIFWDSAFTFSGTSRRGTYGYYEVNDRRIANKAGNNIQSLYIQDQWSAGNRLTLNLGLRTEREIVPTFRPDYLKNAFEFGFGEKIAPRLGAAYDVFGDGRMKVFGSWGLYYDWTKYELPRGSFGAETWCTYYRGLESLDLPAISLSNMPGADIWQTPGTCRDRRVPQFGSDIDPDIEPMKQASTSAGVEYQLNSNSTITAHFIHNDLLQTIEDIGFLNAEGSEGYLIGNPGERATAFQFPTGHTPEGQPTPTPKRKYDALELGYNRRFSNNWFFSANYTLSRLWGNYSGLASSDEVTTPTTGGSSATPQQQAGSIARPGGNVNRAWDLDELLWDSSGNVDVTGRLATDRPHVVKLYGAYDFSFGTQIGAFFSGASGTPITTYVTSTNSADLMPFGRGDLGRTPMLTRTDLLLSHAFVVMGDKQLRLELNVLNLFNQKTSRHIFNFYNKGGIIPDRASSYIDLSGTDLTQGYNVDALLAATPDGLANSRDPRFRQDDLFEDGTRAYFTVKFQF